MNGSRTNENNQCEDYGSTIDKNRLSNAVYVLMGTTPAHYEHIALAILTSDDAWRKSNQQPVDTVCAHSVSEVEPKLPDGVHTRDGEYWLWTEGDETTSANTRSTLFNHFTWREGTLTPENLELIAAHMRWEKARKASAIPWQALVNDLSLFTNAGTANCIAALIDAKLQAQRKDAK